ncbi:hypothetical protein D3C72_1177310 [compost metagenome]
MDNQLEEEIRMYHIEKNKHVITQASSLEAEISFLEKRVNAIKDDIEVGKGKSFHHEMLEEMQTKLTDKKADAKCYLWDCMKSKCLKSSLLPLSMTFRC